MRAYVHLMIICNHRFQLSLTNLNYKSINNLLNVNSMTEFFVRVFTHLNEFVHSNLWQT